MDKNLITPDNIRAIYNMKGYKFFENDSKNYNINVFGIRSSDMTPNVFNDYVCLMWKFKNVWYTKVYDATTDPGLYYLLNPLNVQGTAIMVPGQYLDAYGIGLHHNEYEALRQKSPMKYYRDNNRDAIYNLDNNSIYEGIGYTNIHHASFKGKSVQVDKWSAGCQVIADIVDFEEFMTICKKSRDNFGDSFAYTLLTEKDFANIKTA